MKKKLVLFLLSTFLGATEYVNNYQDFQLINPQNTRNIVGNFAIIGNTAEAVTKCKRLRYKPIDSCEIASNNNQKYFDNLYLTKFIKNSSLLNFNFLDTSTSSSTAYIKLPQNTTKILWAAIVWQGHINNYSYQKSYTSQITKNGHDYYYMGSFDVRKINGKRYVLFHYWKKGKNRYYYKLSSDLPGNKSSGIKQTDANKIMFSIEDLTYNITADKLFYKSDSRYFCNKAGKWCGENLKDYKLKKGVKYSAYKVLNSSIINQLNKKIELAKDSGIPITVSNIQSSWGLEARLGDYAAWSLIVIYATDANKEESKLQNVGIYTGFKSLPKGDIHDMTIKIDELMLPNYGKINSQAAIFTAEGEKSLKGDYIKLNGIKLTEPSSDADNIFDSFLSPEIERSPSLSNNNGIDIDIFDASNAMEKLRDSNPGQDSYTATLQVHSYPDGIFIGLIAFSTQLYQPKICYLETLYTKDGKELKSNDYVNVGDEINVSLTIKNDDNNSAYHLNLLHNFDENKSIYKENSTFVKNVNDSDFIHMSDSENDDLATYKNDTLKINIGRNASAMQGGTFLPNDTAQINFTTIITSTQSFSLHYQTHYFYKIGNKELEYNGQLPKCVDFNNTITPYQPPLGFFNVVDSSFNSNIDPTDTDDPLNALKTAIVNKDYHFKVLHLDNDLQHLTPISGIVFLDVVDATNIDESQQSCVDAPLIYKLPGKTDYVNFGLNNTSKTSSVPITSKILKIAKNATFRVRYIDWPTVLNEKHIPCININEKNGNLKGVPQCLNSTIKINRAFPGTPCIQSSTGAPCKPSHHGVGNPPYDHQYGCIQCLTDYHPSFVCARDNFAIRPYGFVTFADNYLKRAGEDINITVKAVDEGNYTLATGNKDTVKGLSDYNESISALDLNATIYTPTTAEIQQMNKDVYGTPSNDASQVASCPSTGTFTVNPTTFSDGEVNATVQFDETGIITLKVQEKPGQEFALVDANDTPDSQRYIKPSTTITDPDDISKDNLMIFIPYQITTTATSATTNGKNWLYITNDVNNSNEYGVTPSMAAYVTYTITAQNKAGNIVKNFTKTCFPDTDETNAPRRNGLKLNSTFDLFMDLWIKPDQNATLFFYTEDNTSNAIWSLTPKAFLEQDKNNTIQEWIGPDKFENGKAEAKVYFSIERNSSLPFDPITLTVQDANTSTSWMGNTGATNVFNGSNINRSYYFYYGRLHIPTQGINGNSGDVRAYYEIYVDRYGTDPAGIKGAMSVDDVDWYVNSAHTATDGSITTSDASNIDPKITLIQKHAISNGEQNLTFQYTGNRYPYAKTFQIDTQPWLLYDKFDPTVTKAKGRVIFKRAGDWLGRGNRDFTNDTNVPAPKEENDRILW